MPTISVFYGIVIRMYYNDHAPPHFHVEYSGKKAIVEIKSLTVSRGELPKTAKNLVLKWANLHQAELLEDWKLCENLERPHKIEPLE